MAFEKPYGVANCLNRFRRVVWNFDAERFFEGHDELDSIEAVRSQIVNETCVFSDFICFDAKMFYDDLFYTIRDIAHIFLTVSPGDQVPDTHSKGTHVQRQSTFEIYRPATSGGW